LGGATRLVFEPGQPIVHVGRDLGIVPETLRKYVRRVRAGARMPSSQEREEIRKPHRENFEHRERFWVEPI
jgi:transposase-like protein